MRSAIRTFLIGMLFAQLPSIAQAGIHTFDPDGAGALPGSAVGGFDFLPGNTVFSLEDVNTANIYHQSTLGSLLAPDNSVVPTPGMNAPLVAPGSFEITIVAGASATLTPDSTGFIFLGLSSSESYLELYYDDSPDSDPLAGTGYRDGTLIYAGDMGIIGQIFTGVGSQPLDQFNDDDYPGVTVAGSIGSFLIGAFTNSLDSAFFIDPVIEFGAHAGLVQPYFTVDPSAEFEIGPFGSTSILDTATDPSRMQTDANGAFNVPEPSTAGIALALLSATALSRRRTSTKVSS